MRLQYLFGFGVLVLLLAVAVWVALDYIPH
jgi:hypothetical protein